MTYSGILQTNTSQNGNVTQIKCRIFSKIILYLADFSFIISKACAIIRMCNVPTLRGKFLCI